MCAFNDYVVDVDLYVSSYLVPEDFVNESLVCGSCVIELERNLCVAENVVVCVKCCLFFVFPFHQDLMVAFVCV